MGGKGPAGWQPRVAGLVVVAFFGLGVMTGFSVTGHQATIRAIAAARPVINYALEASAPCRAFLFRTYNSVLEVSAPARSVVAQTYDSAHEWAARAGLVRGHVRMAAGISSLAYQTEPAIALIRRDGDFYALAADGSLRGPVTPGAEADLPLITGSIDESHGAAPALEYARTIVRAETELDQIISELRVNTDATVTICLERARIELTIDPADSQGQLERARDVLKQLEGRERMVTGIDMTVPGEAIVRLKNALPAGGTAPRKVVADARRGVANGAEGRVTQ